MNDALKVIPQTSNVSTGVRGIETIAEALGGVLADTYRLVFKTHAYHWNVEGPLFYSIHKMTEEQYEDMFSAADALAERIRALGKLAPSTMGEIMARSVIKDAEGPLNAKEMLDDLASDHERLAHRMHALITLIEGQRDPVTEDLATERSAFHEQAAWMLRSLAK